MALPSQENIDRIQIFINANSQDQTISKPVNDSISERKKITIMIAVFISFLLKLSLRNIHHEINVPIN